MRCNRTDSNGGQWRQVAESSNWIRSSEVQRVVSRAEKQDRRQYSDPNSEHDSRRTDLTCRYLVASPSGRLTRQVTRSNQELITHGWFYIWQ